MKRKALTILEFALFGPVFLQLLFFVFQICVGFIYLENLDYAVNEGGHYVMMNNGESNSAIIAYMESKTIQLNYGSPSYSVNVNSGTYNISGNVAFPIFLGPLVLSTVNIARNINVIPG